MCRSSPLMASSAAAGAVAPRRAIAASCSPAAHPSVRSHNPCTAAPRSTPRPTPTQRAPLRRARSAGPRPGSRSARRGLATGPAAAVGRFGRPPPGASRPAGRPPGTPRPRAPAGRTARGSRRGPARRLGGRLQLVEQQRHREVDRVDPGRAQRRQRPGAEPVRAAARSARRSRTGPARRRTRPATPRRPDGARAGSCAHWDSSVVLPQPAGAATAVSRVAALSRADRAAAAGRHRPAVAAGSSTLPREGAPPWPGRSAARPQALPTRAVSAA